MAGERLEKGGDQPEMGGTQSAVETGRDCRRRRGKGWRSAGKGGRSVEIGGRRFLRESWNTFGGKCRNGFRGSMFCVVPYLSFYIFLIKCMPGCKGPGRGRLKVPCLSLLLVTPSPLFFFCIRLCPLHLVNNEINSAGSFHRWHQDRFILLSVL